MLEGSAFEGSRVGRVAGRKGEGVGSQARLANWFVVGVVVDTVALLRGVRREGGEGEGGRGREALVVR